MDSELSKWKKFYRPKRRALIKLFGGICSCGCGATTKLEFAHTKPTELNGKGRGSFKRLKDVIINPDSYKLLAKTCHRMFDNK